MKPFLNSVCLGTCDVTMCLTVKKLFAPYPATLSPGTEISVVLDVGTEPLMNLSLYRCVQMADVGVPLIANPLINGL